MHGTTACSEPGASTRPQAAAATCRTASRGTGRSVRQVLSVVLVGGMVLVGSAPAAGVAGAPAAPATPPLGVVHLSSGTTGSSQLYTGTRTGWSLTFSPSGTATPEGSAHQGLAFRASDGRLYAVEVTAGPEGPHLLTIDGTGAVTRLGVLTSLAARPGTVAGGTFGEGAYADTYLTVVRDTSGALAGGSLLAVDISADGTLTETTTPLDLPDHVRLGDVAPSGGYLWGVYGQEMYRIDPADGSTASWTLPEGTVGPAPETVFGVAWATGDGEMSFGSQQSGQVTELSVSDQGSDTPTFSVVARHGAPIDTQSDGTYAPPAGPVEIPSPEAPVLVPSPDAPEIDPTDGTRFAGTGVPGHTVTVTFPDGSTARAAVDGDGGWVVPTPSTTFVHGHLVEATATDPSGATSEPACTTVDLIPDEAPTVGASRGPRTSPSTPAGQHGGRP